jgi:RNA polymerase sigma factor (sigma-70 family)
MGVNQPFEKIVAEHGPTVLRVCRAVVGWHDAENAWSETFLSALRAYPELPDTANVEAWLVTIAHRKAIDVLRAVDRAPVPVARLPERSFPDGAGEEEPELWAAVADLPDKQRQVIAYRYVVELSYGEIADIVGGTPAAARRAAADGIKKLRRTYSTATTKGVEHDQQP